MPPAIRSGEVRSHFGVTSQLFAPDLDTTPLALSEVSPDRALAAATGIGELDRVLGGGLVAGSVTVLGGEPGVGKSTLILSHCSAKHVAFAADFGDSLSKTKSSHLLNKSRVEFVVGFCQKTVPAYRFRDPIDFALIDGAHGYPFPEIDYYFIYPHLSSGAILAIDDIHIPTIHNMFKVLREDAMFQLDKIVDTTAFFRRTESPTFDPQGDGWYLQNYNRRYFPVPIVDSRGELVSYTTPDAPKPF